MTHPYSSLEYMHALAEERPLIGFDSNQSYAIARTIPQTSMIDLVGSSPFDANVNLMEGRPIPKGADVPVSYVAVINDSGINSLKKKVQFDFFRPYKERYIYKENERDLVFSKHHRYEIRKSLRYCEVKEIELTEYLDEWCALYELLVERHNISGSGKFSRQYFDALSRMNSFKTFGAFVQGRLVSAHIWLHHDSVVYSHLAASSIQGYSHSAPYAIYDHVLKSDFGEVEFDLGGVPDDSPNAGLKMFKQGFANDIKTNYLCGWVFDSVAYKELCEMKRVKPNSGFFPAYRFPNE